MIETYQNIYFIGIGGIGMSNLARYFLTKGKNVGGYDRTETPLTQQLSNEGAFVHYIDELSEIPCHFLNKTDTLIIYTPAVPATHSELTYFRNHHFTLMKRAQVLGEITKTSNAVCIAGTHGKTTVSSMTAHLLRQSSVDCNAFLGGILKMYDSNLLLSETSNITVVEADEYDRSFHRLRPWIAVITTADPDHLDIYGTAEAYRESFEHFTSLIRADGFLLIRKNVPVTPKCAESVYIYTYSETEGDYHATNIRIGAGKLLFDFVSPTETITDLSLGVPMKINIENMVAAIAVAQLCGVTADEIRHGVNSYSGVKRRFDFRINTNDVVFIDDYAHHPQELTAAIDSIRVLYPHRKISGVFQPHLYSRTRDFVDEFAASLSLLDEVVLLDIYPAREEPIEGVTSQLIFDKITIPEKQLLTKSELLKEVQARKWDVFVTFGAGDIDQLLPNIDALLQIS